MEAIGSVSGGKEFGSLGWSTIELGLELGLPPLQCFRYSLVHCYSSATVFSSLLQCSTVATVFPLQSCSLLQSATVIRCSPYSDFATVSRYSDLLQ
ncbi:hypothetical protein Q3G72_032023 [Acer saccharum]|nr:hypothetical protein Q3G72_032023 [Acer saccharum]